MQDYQAKLVQFFQANAEANLQLAQKLTQTRSPADFVETMSSHMRERIALMTEQAKELAALSQEATRSAVDALATRNDERLRAPSLMPRLNIK